MGASGLKKFFEGPSVTYFGPALGESGRKTTTFVRDLEYFIRAKFHPSCGSVVKADCIPMLIHAIVHHAPPFTKINT